MLTEYLESVSAKPFRWGTHDCAHFVGGWVETLTGSDPLRAFNEYETKRGAWRALKRAGFKTLSDAVTDLLDPVPVGHAQSGDIVTQSDDPNAPLGICEGERSHFVSDEGLISERTLSCGRAWRVHSFGSS